jgi:hypothetical protein
VLALLITAVALDQLGQEAQAEGTHERSERYKVLSQQIARDEEELSSLTRIVARADQLREKLNLKRIELERLQADHVQAGLVEQAGVTLQARADELQTRIETAEAALVGTSQTIEQMREELERRLAPPQIVLGESQPSAGGGASEFDFTLVECRQEGVVVYQGAQRQAVPREALSNRNSAFFQAVERVAEAQADGACLLFLVRSDAFETFAEAQQIARARRCLTSKLPIPGQGAIDLSVFANGA